MHYSKKLRERIEELESEVALLATQVQNKSCDIVELKKTREELAGKVSSLLKENDALSGAVASGENALNMLNQLRSKEQHDHDHKCGDLQKQVEGERGWRKFYGALLAALLVLLGAFAVGYAVNQSVSSGTQLNAAQYEMNRQ